MLTGTLAKTPLGIFLLASLVSAVGSVGLMVWLTMGPSGGIFWGAFGDRQYSYYLIVAVVILTALCVSRSREFNTVRLLGACALGGYCGGLLAYYLLAYHSIIGMATRGHYYILALPLWLPTHIIFVCAGIIAALFMIAGGVAYRALSAKGTASRASEKRDVTNCGAIEIEQEVLSVLATLTPRGTVIAKNQRLIADLKLASDDATAMALQLERKFGVKIPRDEWRRVLTVQDTIDLLVRHLVRPA
jgi:acyl carrier protein